MTSDVSLVMLAGPSFPVKRTREPASFANGVYRPELKPMHPPTTDCSQQVTARLPLHLVLTMLIFFHPAEEYFASA